MIEWPVVPFEVRETDVAVEIATEQMRACPAPRVPHCLLRLRWSFVCSRCRYGYGLALGATVGKKQIEADEHYGFGERTGLLDKLAERKTNWTTDLITAHLAMKCIRQFRSLLACVQKSDMAFF